MALLKRHPSTVDDSPSPRLARALPAAIRREKEEGGTSKGAKGCDGNMTSNSAIHDRTGAAVLSLHWCLSLAVGSTVLMSVAERAGPRTPMCTRRSGQQVLAKQ
ncbi:hypothetical protein E2C01_066282 [Portunus trituberculatus]|uniref:Uncharacterized protein n=1 Tax=Portunus trituberculatus TaxID=210409 RepID=A0A5B7HHT6_PORTR|nr:hypothetical protein [Portunus trituberculatus]